MYSRRGKQPLQAFPATTTPTDKRKEFKTMQDFIAIATIFIALSFTVIVMIDFISGLVAIWEKAGSQSPPQVSANVLIEQSPAPKLKAEVTPDPWLLPTPDGATLPVEQIVRQQQMLPPARVQFSTLQWVESNLPPVETFIVEMPCAIAMAKGRLPKVAPVLDLATQAQLAALGIRRCKKLASQLGVRGYSSLKLSQLVERLEGKVLQSQLVA
jgi:hypothetical protein